MEASKAPAVPLGYSPIIKNIRQTACLPADAGRGQGLLPNEIYNSEIIGEDSSKVNIICIMMESRKIVISPR